MVSWSLLQSFRKLMDSEHLRSAIKLKPLTGEVNITDDLVPEAHVVPEHCEHQYWTGGPVCGQLGACASLTVPGEEMAPGCVMGKRQVS